MVKIEYYWKRAVIALLLTLAAGCSGNAGELPATEERLVMTTDGGVEVIMLPTATLEPFSMTVEAAGEPVSEPIPGPVAPAPQEPAQPLPTHTVQGGDTLLALALRYDLPMAALQLQNDMGASTVVQAGQVLEIPPATAWAGASPYWRVYEVAPGETLSEIAKAYGLSVGDIESANGISAANPITVGQLLVLPLESLVDPATPEPPPAPTATPTPIILPTPTATPLSQAADAPTSAPAPPPADVAAWPYEVVRLMNDVRAQHGLPPLAYNETLAQAAQAHANDCVQRGYCSHTGSDGADIKTRIVRAGYDPASWAECWAQQKTPQGAIDVWMDEIPPNDPHRRTLLTTWLTEIGVGVAKTSWGYYFIADFGKPK
ncbi:MAG: LysM peptidoglycan-binding domain-containing protein [Anaerolineae bacterium]|nr:LysM peptidoglycan-binding domain-containing protein [Anaerolineae bacterium]